MAYFNDKNWPRAISRSDRLFEFKFKPFRNTKAWYFLKGQQIIGYTVDFTTWDAIAGVRTRLKKEGINPLEGAILITRNEAL